MSKLSCVRIVPRPGSLEALVGDLRGCLRDAERHRKAGQGQQADWATKRAQEVFKRIVSQNDREIGRRLLRYARARFPDGSAEELEDATVEMLRCLWSDLADLKRPTSPFEVCFNRCLLCLCIDACRVVRGENDRRTQDGQHKAPGGRPISLDIDIGSDSVSLPPVVPPAGRQVGPELEVLGKYFRETLLSTLDARDADILEDRLNGDTWEEIATKYGITVSQVRHSVHKTIKKLHVVVSTDAWRDEP
jgi:DNA-directed RNA polymerase specialized sigma24 family protein